MELVLISYPEFFDGEAGILAKLLSKYEFTLHLRKPMANEKNYSMLLEQIPTYLHKKIVIHNEGNLINEYDLKGVHLSAIKREESNIKASVEFLGTSCHSLEEVGNLPAKFTQCYLSPVFPSISKQGYDRVLNREELKRFLDKDRKMRIIGLGGISSERLNELEDLNFDGYAVLGAVWTSNPEECNRIEENFKKIHDCIMNDHIV